MVRRFKIMAITYCLYDSPTHRTNIKLIFGNRRNWQRFVSIAHRMEAEISLRLV